jgi:exodeoxyribonuclease-3
MATNFRLASVNVNGIRAAFRNGMGDWLASRELDVLALQEVRADTSHVEALFGDGWHILHDAALAKGRAGVALVSRAAPIATRVGLGAESLQDSIQSSGRWLEADYDIGGTQVTVVSVYVHSGEVDTPRQAAKWAFLDAMGARLDELRESRDLVAVVGDLNVGHTKLDIKNWKGNVKRSGFLPRERSYFDRFFGARDTEVSCTDESTGSGHGWVDVGREFHGGVDAGVEGPYSWWSNRGQAFDNDTGWRIDYHMVTPALAAKVENYAIDRAASYRERWSDHAPVVVDYAL